MKKQKLFIMELKKLKELLQKKTIIFYLLENLMKQKAIQYLWMLQKNLKKIIKIGTL